MAVNLTEDILHHKYSKKIGYEEVRSSKTGLIFQATDWHYFHSVLTRICHFSAG